MVQDRGNRDHHARRLTTVQEEARLQGRHSEAVGGLAADLYYDWKCTVVHLNARPGSCVELPAVRQPQEHGHLPRGPAVLRHHREPLHPAHGRQVRTFKISTYGGSVDGTG
jgi:hypothetical protein